MKLSFKYKFILSFVILEIIFISLIVIYNFTSFKNLSNSLIQTNIESSSKLLSELIKAPLIVNDLATIDYVLENYSQMDYVTAVKIINTKNIVISHIHDKNLKYRHIFDDNIENIEIDSKKFQLKTLSIDINGWKLADVKILFELSDIYKVIKENEERTIFLIFLEILMSSILAYFIGYSLNKRLSSLTLLAQEIPNNRYVYIQKDEKIVDEISILSNTLSQMQDKIFERNSEMKDIQSKLEKYIQLVNKNIIISRTNTDGIITDVSEAFCKISGFSKNELIGQSHVIMRHEDTPIEVYENLWKTIKNGEIWKSEVKNKTKNGNFYWTDSTISPDYDNNGNIIGYFAIRHDITNKKFIENLSITDSLTKLYNRRYFDDIFSKELHKARRDKKTFCLLMLDVDSFKLYNDTYGHQEGDFVLQSISKVLLKNLKRSSDFAFRIGGEEFSAIFTIDKEENIYEFSEQIRVSIENLCIEHEKNSASSFITVSIGASFINFQQNSDIEIIQSDLYKYTDRLLYKAKSLGRNKVCIENFSKN